MATPGPPAPSRPCRSRARRPACRRTGGRTGPGPRRPRAGTTSASCPAAPGPRSWTASHQDVPEQPSRELAEQGVAEVGIVEPLPAPARPVPSLAATALEREPGRPLPPRSAGSDCMPDECASGADRPVGVRVATQVAGHGRRRVVRQTGRRTSCRTSTAVMVFVIGRRGTARPAGRGPATSGVPRKPNHTARRRAHGAGDHRPAAALRAQAGGSRRCCVVRDGGWVGIRDRGAHSANASSGRQARRPGGGRRTPGRCGPPGPVLVGVLAGGKTARLAQVRPVPVARDGAQVCGAPRRSDSSGLLPAPTRSISPLMAIIASTEPVDLAGSSDSVGSTMRVPATGNDIVGAWKP